VRADHPIRRGITVQLCSRGPAEFGSNVVGSGSHGETGDSSRVPHLNDQVDQLTLEEACTFGQQDAKVGGSRRLSDKRRSKQWRDGWGGRGDFPVSRHRITKDMRRALLDNYGAMN